jgi:hypothetical protein
MPRTKTPPADGPLAVNDGRSSSKSETAAIILGASNVTLGFPLIVPQVRRMMNGPVQLFAAHGHGRSYGRWSRAGFRALPGIRHCALWDDFRRWRDSHESPTPTFALVTDIGNDLLFGASPEETAGWVDECLARLVEAGAVLTLCRLPIDSLTRLGQRRFLAIRSLFFPGSRLSYERMQQDVPRLNELIIELARKRSAEIIAPSADWYGFDPIHIRRTQRNAAWRLMLSRWNAPEPETCIHTRPRRRDWLLRPGERTLFGRSQRHPQPARQTADGSGIWLY